MKTQSPDTSPEMEKILFDLLRQAGPQRRFELARAITKSSMERSRRRIAVHHPDWSPQEVAINWVEIMYGGELSTRLRRELERRGQLT